MALSYALPLQLEQGRHLSRVLGDEIELAGRGYVVADTRWFGDDDDDCFLPIETIHL